MKIEVIPEATYPPVVCKPPHWVGRLNLVNRCLGLSGKHEALLAFPVMVCFFTEVDANPSFTTAPAACA